jgi:hypothetical protein
VSVKMISAQFVAKVRAGTKRQTVRPARKYPHKVGDVLDLREWSGRPYRSKQLAIIMARCTDYFSIRIFEDGYRVDGITTHRPQDLLAMARADGFESWAEMADWFAARYGLPFDGYVTAWRPL